MLLYHSIGNTRWAVSESMFRMQLAWLSQRATIIPLAKAMESDPHSRLRVAITFDDGYASLHDQAAPLLAAHGATATVFLNTGWIGESTRKASDASLGHFAGEYFMNWSEAAALAQAGWTIGSHGVEHLDLIRQEPPRAVQELRDSKQRIEARLARPCEHFAYPWGRFNAGLKRQVERAGYISAAAGIHGPVSTGADPFALPRIDVRAEYELQDFEDIVTGRWDFLGLKQQLARAFA